MSIKHSLLLLLWLGANSTMVAETVTEYILDTVDSGEGSWPCLFYELNYNSDISQAEQAKWHSLDEDESYWREGIGPFSIDENKFLVTQWQSTIHPILIRRHFTLTEEDVQKISVGTVTLTYSYDENPTFWLNGTKLTSASGWNDDNYATFRIPTVRKKLMVEGNNVLCVSLQQGAGGGHIDFGLSVKYDPAKVTPVPLVQEAEEETAWYDLSGRPTGNEQKGIIITKGKKIIKK